MCHHLSYKLRLERSFTKNKKKAFLLIKRKINVKTLLLVMAFRYMLYIYTVCSRSTESHVTTVI